jgi:uncharacterized membrane protein YraQ (UPF0718 family)
MLGAASLTCRWLYERVYVDFKGVDLTYLDYELPRPILCLIMAAVVGLVMGFFIPHWYRLHQKRSAEENMRRVTLTGVAQQHRPSIVA